MRIELLEAACSSHSGTALPRFLAFQLAAAAAAWGVVHPEFHKVLHRVALPIAVRMLHVGLLRSQLQSSSSSSSSNSSKGQDQTAVSAAAASAAAAAAAECWLDVAHWAAWALCVVLTRRAHVGPLPPPLPVGWESPAIPLALQLCGHLAPPTSGCRLSLAASAALTLPFHNMGECV